MIGGATQSDFNKSLKKFYGAYTLGFIGFLIVLTIAEVFFGLADQWIGYIFLFATIGLYAMIGIMSRTMDVSEYYVAGRRVPALFNGMATGSDWMSAASFIGMAGTFYLQGYDGLAFCMGWTGGYCLVALFLAPYLRKFGQFTIPDFLGARYGGNLARLIGVFSAILVSFVYVVAQIYGVGIITARFTGLEFAVGVFVGLAGILVCSFLGGMRAVTWTQVAQYIILIIAYLIPLVMLSVKHKDGNPLPHLTYGFKLQTITEREGVLRNDPKEAEVRKVAADRAAAYRKLIDDSNKPEGEVSNIALGTAVAAQLAAAQVAKAPARDTGALTRAAEAIAKGDRAAFRDALRPAMTGNTATSRSTVRAHATPFPGATPEARNTARLNFLTLVFCLMVGTAALPHILMRYYTTPNVKEARLSVFWSLVCICALYFSAPALAVLVKYEIYNFLVGSSFATLPEWVKLWSRVDPTLLTIIDVNGDGLVQLAEMTIGGDIIVLATPEIAGLPYVISGLVAAGGLAAALSTADGLLLTMANALSHDVYYKMIDPTASTKKRVTVSKTLLLVVALLAAWVTSYKPGDILFLVGAAFSMAASAFFPALVLGVFWKRANKWGAVTGMIVGLGVCLFYQVGTYPFFQNITGWKMDQWFGIAPISAGIFGMPVGMLTLIIVSLLTKAPEKDVQELVEHVRYPSIKGSTMDTTAR